MNTNTDMLRIDKSNTETDLLKDCLRGNQKAQKSLYERFAPKMLGVCLRYICDRGEAEHVMIGGMVKVFEKLKQYEQHGSFEGWIRRIMVTESLMYIRKYKNMSLQVEIENAGELSDFGALEHKLETQDLLLMIADMPVGYRTVFNLFAIEGYNHKEIGDMLGINENTSKSQLSRARKYLQSRIVSIEKSNFKHSNHGK